MLSAHRAAVGALMAMLVVGLSVAGPDALAVPDRICVIEVLEGDVVREDCYVPGVGESPGENESVAAPGPQVCTTGTGEQVPCVTALGTWAGSCYARPKQPQPGPEDPVWAGRVDGLIIECVRSTGGTYFTVSEYWASVTPSSTVVDESEVARRAIAQLQLAPITIGMAPPPKAEPNVLIHTPAYFWAEGGTPAIGPLISTVTQDGMTVSLHATLTDVVFDTGDGSTVTCGREDVATKPTVMTLDGDPVCGHAWEHSGSYTLTATSTWSIAWQGPTQSGTLAHTLTESVAVGVTDRPVNLTTNGP